MVIAEPEGFSPLALKRLREYVDVELRHFEKGSIGEAFQEFDIVWIALGHRVEADTILRSGRCCILATPVTGLDRIDVDACRRAGIRVVSLKGEREFLRDVRATAELTLGLAIALMRRLVPASLHVRDGGWNRDLFCGHELFGTTAGIIGLGRLGTVVSRYLSALGMSVIGFDPFVTVVPNVEVVDSLAELLSRSDLITLHVSYDASTHHLIGSTELASANPGAVLINTARGELIDGQALLEALMAGRLAGAALDVVAGEPDVTGDHPLVRYANEHDNLLIVPHIGGNTYESTEKTQLFLTERVLEAVTGAAVSQPKI